MKFEASDTLSLLLETRTDVQAVFDLCVNAFNDEDDTSPDEAAEIGIEMAIDAASKGLNLYVARPSNTADVFFFAAKSEAELVALVEAMPEDEESDEDEDDTDESDDLEEDEDEDDA